MLYTELQNKRNLTENQTGKTPINNDPCKLEESFEKNTPSNMYKIGVQGISKK